MQVENKEIEPLVVITLSRSEASELLGVLNVLPLWRISGCVHDIQELVTALGVPVNPATHDKAIQGLMLAARSETDRLTALGGAVEQGDAERS